MITHATFEALSVFDDGYTHWLPPETTHTNGLRTSRYIEGNAETGYRLTLKGEAALTEYRAKHQLIAPTNYHRAG